MHGSQIQSLHVVERDWRIDEKAEEPRTNKIPECYGDEEVDGPFVIGDPRRFLGRTREAQVLPCFKADQRQRYYLKCTEYCAQCDDGWTGTGKVEMVERSNDAACQEDDGGEQHRARCAANLKQPEARKEECDHDGCEYFEEAFNPEVNNPPAPIFRGDQVTALAVHQSGCVEALESQYWK